MARCRRVRELARRRRRAETDPRSEVDDGPAASDDHQKDRLQPDAARRRHVDVVAVSGRSNGALLEHIRQSGESFLSCCTGLPLARTRWFNQHFQATVHVLLTNAVD